MPPRSRPSIFFQQNYSIFRNKYFILKIRRPDLLPVEDDLPLLTGRREDDIHALPLSSRPVVVAQIPPPPSRVQRFNNVPSIPLNSQVVLFKIYFGAFQFLKT